MGFVRRRHGWWSCCLSGYSCPGNSSKKPGQRGALERTSNPRDERIWVKIQTGCRAGWILPALKTIQVDLERTLRNQIKSESRESKQFGLLCIRARLQPCRKA